MNAESQSQDENPYAPPRSFIPPRYVSAEGRLPDRIVPCPVCHKSTAVPVPYDPARGRAGPRAVDHVVCTDCGAEYNGETGRPIRNYTLLNVLIPLIAFAGGVIVFVAMILLG